MDEPEKMKMFFVFVFFNQEKISFQIKYLVLLIEIELKTLTR
jgi:hypothetical protein